MKLLTHRRPRPIQARVPMRRTPTGTLLVLVRGGAPAPAPAAPRRSPSTAA